MKNFLLLIRSYIRLLLNKTNKGNEDQIPSGYRIKPLSFGIGFPWGSFHPKNLNQYWKGKDCVTFNDNCIMLNVRKTPHYFGDILIPYNIGVIQSSHKFEYGYFTAEILMPSESGQWPAFWLYGSQEEKYSEIDIVEAYSNSGNYGHSTKFQPNLHYAAGKKWKMYGAVNRHITYATRRFVKYSMHWTKDFVKIYYDGFLVMDYRDKSFLSKLLPMNLVCNSAVKKEFNPPNFSIVTFRNINVYQKNNHHDY